MYKKIRVGVLLSGGLDSLLTVKIMQEQGVDVFALFFKLPFSMNLEKDLKEFSKKQKIKLKILDCTRGELLREYFRMIKCAKHGRGAGFNPCIDCRIFLFKKAREFIKKNKLSFLVTGEVLDERPMSQKQKIMRMIDEESELKGMILRPLSAKLLDETIPEKNRLVNREAFFDIHGKRRIRQMEMAKKFNFSYPSPAGGCLICEKGLKKRFKLFFAKEELWNYFYLLAIGRHFFIENSWVILGRNERENKILENVKGVFLVTPNYTGPSVLAFGKIEESLKSRLSEMVKAYSKKGSLDERKVFEKYKI
jgi:tRNA-uridine 2-sulfurtransferase